MGLAIVRILDCTDRYLVTELEIPMYVILNGFSWLTQYSIRIALDRIVATPFLLVHFEIELAG